MKRKLQHQETKNSNKTAIYSNTNSRQSLEATLVDKQKYLQELEAKASNYKAFMSTIKKYTRMKKLTRGILYDLVEKIVVHHAKKKMVTYC